MHESCLLKLCRAETWHKGSYTHGCPRPILITKHHQRQLEELHEALTLAITDIVQRWWTDDTARFPQRMPLPTQEEELLQVCYCSMCPTPSIGLTKPLVDGRTNSSRSPRIP